MCGIIGYIGKDKAHRRIYEAIKKLEYRGYDSCGISIVGKRSIKTVKRVGDTNNLRGEISNFNPKNFIGIGHTRWATHGKVTEENAHPHISNDGRLSLVHNGVIENSETIKNFLSIKGFSFYSETDTEVLVNLISYFLCPYSSDGIGIQKEKLSLIDAMRTALEQVEGTYGIAVLDKSNPETIVGAKKGSPLIFGMSGTEKYLSSDSSAFPPEIEKLIYLEDNQIISLDKEKYKIVDLNNEIIEPKEIASKGSGYISSYNHKGFSCFMEKEIFNQPDSIRNAMRGRFEKDLSNVKFGGISQRGPHNEIKKVLLLGCGTAYYAALVGKYAIENIANIPVSIEFGSEYRYKNNPVEDGTLVVAISQSGETIDTLTAVQEAKRKGLETIAITNTVSSSIAREVNEGIYQMAGPELSVASTKAFTSQVTILLMLSILLGRRNNLSVLEAKKYINQLRLLPELARITLESTRKQVQGLSKIFQMQNCMTFLGRQSMYPIALEAALKMKEITYINAQGYPAGEFKHGPLAIVREGSLCIYFATQDELVEKNISNMKELRSRGARIIAVKQDHQSYPEDLFDHCISIPSARSFILPVLSIIPMQLFAMYMSLSKNLNPDRPRNLAKSVTVE